MIHDDVFNYLATVLVGQTVKKDQLAPSPDNMIVVFNRGGSSTIRSTVTETNVQVIVRNLTFDQCKADAQAVYNALHNNSSIGGNIRLIRAASLPISMGPDDNGRAVFSLNFKVEARGL